MLCPLNVGLLQTPFIAVSLPSSSESPLLLNYSVYGQTYGTIVFLAKVIC